MPLIPDIRQPNQKPTKKIEVTQPPAPRRVDRPAATIRPPKRPKTPRAWPKFQINRKRLWTGIGITLGVLIILGAYCGWQAKQLYTEALYAKGDLEGVVADVQAKDYPTAKIHLVSATQHITKARAASRGLWPIKWLPYIHTQFVVLDSLLEAGEHIGTAGSPLLTIAEQVEQVVGDESVTVNKISKAERRALLQTLHESPDTLAAAQVELRAAVDALRDLPTAGVIAPLALVVDTIQTNLPNLEAAVDKGMPFLTVAPTIAGYPTEKTYLFLLQNNTELRPTGGFIGTYGILQLQDGDIVEFKTDNIYNIDNKVKDTWSEKPPADMQKYLSASRWFLRDVNWDPDFPTTAARAIDFYLREQNSTQQIDGVIAVTPEVIHDLLEMTGPITVEGEEYTAENLTEKLQYEVEIGYFNEGISDASRKAVIGKLAGELMDRIQSVPQSQWGDLANIFLTNVEEKHLLLYSTDDSVQTLVHEIGWDGAITQTDGDYVMVVDANLAAKKTDRVMTKVDSYTITKDGNDYIAELKLVYTNDGVFDDFTTRYRSFLRVYVPQGSTLMDSSGFLTTDRYLGGEATTATQTEDTAVHKAILEGFISVEPKTSETITLTYRLPERIAEQISDGTYTFYWQKQPGTNNVNATVDLDFGARVTAAATLDETAEIDNTKVHFTKQLLRDLILTVSVK